MKKLIFALFICIFLVADEGISQTNAYRNNSDMQWQLATDNLKEFKFEKIDAVLDVGCGDGKITDFIAEKVPDGHVVGLVL